jgi:hypothetical protein
MKSIFKVMRSYLVYLYKKTKQERDYELIRYQTKNFEIDSSININLHDKQMLTYFSSSKNMLMLLFDI